MESRGGQWEAVRLLHPLAATVQVPSLTVERLRRRGCIGRAGLAEEESTWPREAVEEEAPRWRELAMEEEIPWRWNGACVCVECARKESVRRRRGWGGRARITKVAGEAGRGRRGVLWPWWPEGRRKVAASASTPTLLVTRGGRWTWVSRLGRILMVSGGAGKASDMGEEQAGERPASGTSSSRASGPAAVRWMEREESATGERAGRP